MAYLTCPWCLTPQLIVDESPECKCYTCAAEVRFFKCANCSMVQTVSKEWRTFTCGVRAKVELPDRWGYDVSATAVRVEGRQAWPPL